VSVPAAGTDVHGGRDDPRAPELVAYRVMPGQGSDLVPAARSRDWIDGTADRFATRCLPLLMANQAGWMVLGRHRVTAVWSGGDDIASLRVTHTEGVRPFPAVSHFGYGILTWTLPYLFRTPPGYDLLVRGPANMPRDGACALEGLVETDWAVATFTVNWKLTRPWHAVVFEPGEPICMIVPQRRGDCERFEPAIRNVGEDPELAAAHARWWDSRDEFLASMRAPGWRPGPQAWQKDYYRGRGPGGPRGPDHRRKLTLRPFRDYTAMSAAPPLRGPTPQSVSPEHEEDQ
jgi:hypothetical protein